MANIIHRVVYVVGLYVIINKVVTEANRYIEKNRGAA